MYTINKKAKYHSLPEIKAEFDNETGFYTVFKGDMLEGTKISYEYVAFKCKSLLAWLRAENVSGNLWLDSMYGSMAGLRLMYETEWEVIDYCKKWGKECEAMLCPELIEYEGLQVRARLKWGGIKEGIVIRSGKTPIKTHSIRGEGKKTGGYIKPYMLESVELL